MFQSIGRCVNIGVLKSATADTSLSKDSDNNYNGISERKESKGDGRSDFDTGDTIPVIQDIKDFIVLTSEPAAYNGVNGRIYI